MSVKKSGLIDKIIKLAIAVLFIYLPVFEILRSTSLKNAEIFNLSIIELVNMFLILLSFLLTFIKLSKKSKVFVILSFCILGLYIGLHCYNVSKFNLSVYPSANISVTREIYYILRVYVLPLLLLFVLCKNRKTFDKKFYSCVIKYLIIFISLNIIVLNILKISFGSYMPDGEYVKYSILDFSQYRGHFKYLLTRGRFNSANELSAILLTLMPLNIFLFYKEKKISNVFLCLIQIISMIIVGTRTAAIGSLLVMFTSLAIYLFLLLIKVEKVNIKFLISYVIITGLSLSFYCYSPFTKINNVFIDNIKLEDNYKKVDEIQESHVDTQTKADQFMSKIYDFGINMSIIAIYPPQLDLDFWYEVAKRPRIENNDSRVLKGLILGRIKEKNNRKLDDAFGIGYTVNMVDIERDYVYQYYLYGIVGLILLMSSYPIIYFRSAINMIKHLKQKFNYPNILLFMSPLLCMVIAYFSGHVFGWVSPTFILSLSLSLLNWNNMEDCND